MAVKSYEFLATDKEKDLRIDVYLTSVMNEFSRSHVQKLIAAEQVQVNGKIIRANYKLQNNDRIEMTIPEACPAENKAEDIPLSICYEDEDVIVVNKPRGLVVHPAAGHETGTLVNALLMHCHDLSGINGDLRPGIVHRLDKDTSGVMVAAKNDRAHMSLAAQIKARTAGRLYYAIVQGNIKENEGVVDAPIGRHSTDRKKMAVTFKNSKPATTKFRVLERFGDFTWVECMLLTGRTHQIRVHMAYIGHPVVGDPKYGPRQSLFSIAGQALHSAELHFSHPASGKEMVFRAPLPEDMMNILLMLRAKKKQ
ncbi:MAG: rluD 3 [Firmicutes bacterium]|nr:rluD 3 [Bacillota bacterium]